MKRWLFCLSLLLVYFLIPIALADGQDDQLDIAFENGKILIREAAFQYPDPEKCEIILPSPEALQAFGLSGVSKEEVRSLILGVAVISYSPDGTHGVGMAGLNGSDALPVAVSPNRIAFIFPTEARGVSGQSDMLFTLYSRAYLHPDPRALLGIGSEGVIWSPSGRYYCILNSNMLFTLMQVDFCSPVIVDTHTGEMFAMDSFTKKFNDENYGGWITGCFSEDESSFIGLYSGRRYESKYALVRYDLEKAESEIICDLNVNCRSSLALLQSGDYFALLDTNNVWKSPQSLARISRSGTVDTVALTFFQDSDRMRLYMRYADYSVDSGWALLRGDLYIQNDTTKKTDTAPIALMRLWMDESLSEGTDTLWMISAQTLQPVPLSQIEITEYYANDFDRYWSGIDYLNVFDVKLSPSGRYAAVLAGAPDGLNHDEIAVLLIVRLSDMKALPVENFSLDYKTLRYRTDTNLLNWSEAGLFCLVSGFHQLYTE